MLISCFGRYPEGALHIRSTQDYSLLPQYQACDHPDGIRVAKFSHDNSFLYCLTGEDALVSWESATGEFTEIYPRGVWSFDIYGEMIMAGFYNGKLRIWAREESGITALDTINVGDKSLTSMTISSDGLVAASQGSSVHIVDPISHNITKIITSKKVQRIDQLSFSETTGSLALAVTATDREIYLCSRNGAWSTTWQAIPKVNYPKFITWVRGKPIVCIGWDDGSASLWNVETQTIIFGPLYHSDGDCQVAISPDGKTLATGTAEDCIKIWDVEMLLGLGESGVVNHFQILKAENPQLFDRCQYENEWVIGPDGERLLWIPEEKISLLFNPALKHTLLPMSMQLDLSKFVHGTDWIKCYSEDVYGNQQK